MDKKTGLVIIGVIVLILIIWGLIGGSIARDVGFTCDIGLGKSFCWQWHKNIVGQAGEFVNNLLG